MQDTDYDDMYSGGNGRMGDKRPAFCAWFFVLAAVAILAGVSISFSGSVMF